MNNFEKKFGKYAIPNLTLALILGYAVGYVITLVDNARGTYFLNYLYLDPFKILSGQVWRLITWVLVPPTDSNIFFVLIMVFCLFSFGTTLERAWGTVKYNLYIFGGVFLTVISSFIFMLYLCIYYGSGNLVEGFTSMQAWENVLYSAPALNGTPFWAAFSTYYINILIYLGYAMTFPNVSVRLWFLIPVKMKWLGVVDALFMVYYFIFGGIATRFAVGAAMVNVALFYFLCLRKGGVFDFKQKARQAKFKKAYRDGQKRNFTVYNGGGEDSDQVIFGKENSQNVYERYSGGESTQAHKAMKNPGGITRHKCAICGQTEVSNPGLDFRFCSKCNGNYEYCSNHIFTHEHIK